MKRFYHPFAFISSFAQDNVKIKQKELGITFQSLNNFGELCRFGINKAISQIHNYTKYKEVV